MDELTFEEFLKRIGIDYFPLAGQEMRSFEAKQRWRDKVKLQPGRKGKE